MERFSETRSSASSLHVGLEQVPGDCERKKAWQVEAGARPAQPDPRRGGLSVAASGLGPGRHGRQRAGPGQAPGPQELLVPGDSQREHGWLLGGR